MNEYIYLDCKLFTDPRMAIAGTEAQYLWICALCHSEATNRKGFVTDEAASIIGEGLIDVQNAVDRLVDVGLWERVKGGYSAGDGSGEPMASGEMLWRKAD